MKKIFFLSLVLLSNLSMFSQQRVGSGFSVIYGKQRLDLTKSYVNEDAEVEGKPFFVENFLPANVKGYDGMFLLRYNAYRDEMEFQKDDEIHFLVKSDSLEINFVNSKKLYKFLEHNFNKENIKGFLVVLNENAKVSLYKKERITFAQKVYATNSYKSDTPAHYELQKDTFFIKKDDAIVPFPKNKKELAKMFPGKENQILEFLKSNSLSLSKESELISIVSFLNSL